MKRLILGLFTIASIAVSPLASAQNLSFEKGDSVSAVYTSGLLTLHNDIVNSGSVGMKVIWRVTNHDFPISWAGTNLGICDNETCYSNANDYLTNSNSNTSLFYAPMDTGLFDMQIDLTSATPGSHYMFVNAKDSANTSDQKNMKFIITKFTTGVVTVTRTEDNVVLYPNPVNDELNVLFNDLDVKNIAVYNVIGKTMLVYKVSGNSAKMDIDKLPNGVYFVRLSDATGQVVATKRFTKQ